MNEKEINLFYLGWVVKQWEECLAAISFLETTKCNLLNQFAIASKDAGVTSWQDKKGNKWTIVRKDNVPITIKRRKGNTDEATA